MDLLLFNNGFTLHTRKYTEIVFRLGSRNHLNTDTAGLTAQVIEVQ